MRECHSRREWEGRRRKILAREDLHSRALASNFYFRQSYEEWYLGLDYWEWHQTSSVCKPVNSRGQGARFEIRRKPGGRTMKEE
jgi:hypothetical protein